MSVNTTTPTNTSFEPINIGRDDVAILQSMQRIEETMRPGLLVLQFNGNNWQLYEPSPPRWLPRC